MLIRRVIDICDRNLIYSDVGKIERFTVVLVLNSFRSSGFYGVSKDLFVFCFFYFGFCFSILY